jgi:type VI secretion system secreted protein Hcp
MWLQDPEVVVSAMTIDCFLQIPGIAGESTDRNFAGQIDVLSWKFGATHPGAPHIGPGGSVGRVDVRDLAVTKWLDRATPALVQACCAGRHFANATLTCRRGGSSPVRYVRLNFDDVLITSVATGGSADEGRFTEEISLNFAKFTITYTPQKPDGTADADVGPLGWNIGTNAPV